VTVERAGRIAPGASGVAEQRAALVALTERRQPLPFARSIVERTQLIPGWFGGDEAELLIALTLRAAGTAQGCALTVVEIGSFCGRATLTIALALHGLGRSDARVIAVAEPTLGLAPDGQSPANVLRDQLTRFEVRHLVVCAPEEDPEPWLRASRLLLVDGRHDLAGIRDDLERFLPRLEADGLLVFHDYAPYFPDVQHVVEELLLDPEFAFVAHVGSLIALTRQPPRSG
jgi:hypothetical protein